MIYYINKKRSKGSTFKKGDKIYFLYCNIYIKKSNNKFDYRKIGSFRIKQKCIDIVYEFELSEETRLYFRFYISLLESVVANISIQREIQVEIDEMDYEVEVILDYRKARGQEEYFIKWKGYSISENIWESIYYLKQVQCFLQQYLRGLPDPSPFQRN